MIQLFTIYKWNLICGFFAAISLSWLGCHIATRGKSLQSLALSQGAILGVLLASGIFGAGVKGPLLMGLVVAYIIFYGSEKIINLKPSSSATSLLSLFSLLMAANYWIISYFPNLEGHMSQAFFGDLVTMGEAELWIMGFFSIVTISVLLIFQKSFLSDSFDSSIFGISFVEKKFTWNLFNYLCLALLATSIFSLGFLFTIAILFIPTMLFSFQKKSSALHHYLQVTTTAATGTIFGFLSSLYWDWLPTIPTIILLVAIIGTLLLFSQKVASIATRMFL